MAGTELADQLRARIAVVEALAAAVERRQEVVDVLAEADDPATAREALMSLLGIDADHAQAVMDLRLYRLTAATRREIHGELSDLRARLEGA